jgi:hypothetical protein
LFVVLFEAFFFVLFVFEIQNKNKTKKKKRGRNIISKKKTTTTKKNKKYIALRINLIIIKPNMMSIDEILMMGELNVLMISVLNEEKLMKKKKTNEK